MSLDWSLWIESQSLLKTSRENRQTYEIIPTELGATMAKLMMGLVLFFSAQVFAQTGEVLLQKTLTLKAPDIAQVLAKTESNIKVFAENFNVRLDSKSKITTPRQVIGPVLQPVYKISVKKCVFFICQTIDLDAEFSLKKVTGQCNFNYLLRVDLQRSSALLADLYSAISAGICVQKSATGGVASVQVNLLHAPNYSTGIVQKQAFELISLQGESILETVKTVMKLNGVTEIK